MKRFWRNQVLFRQFIKICANQTRGWQWAATRCAARSTGALSKTPDTEIQLKSMRERRLIRLNVLMDVSPNTPADLPTTMPKFSGVIAKEPTLYQRALETRRY